MPAVHDSSTSVPHSARIWNYWLGGKDNYTVDREAGDAYRAIAPQVVAMAVESRRFLVRTVTTAARDLGVRQFLDIGTGLPTASNTHEVAQQTAPDAKIVYVDNDPTVLAHAKTLLYGTPEGATDYIGADVRDPDTVLEQARRTLDFSRPVALMLMGILGHVEDHAEATAIVRQLTAALPAGSYLIHYDGVDTDPALTEAQAGYDATGAVPYVLRSPAQLAVYYEGLDVLPPGIVPCPLWRPASQAAPQPTDIYGGIGRKT